MNNLKSYTEYAVTTPTTDFVIGFDFNYGTDAVNVTVDGVPASLAGYSVIYLNSTTMRLSPAVPSGVVRLQRETNIDVPDNQFTAGAKFIASNMDENFTQIRHAQQEVRDGFEKLSEDTYEIIDTLQDVGQAAQDAADAAEQAAQTANDAAAQVNDKVSYQDLDTAVDVAVETAVAPVRAYTALPFDVGKSYDLNERVTLENGDVVVSSVEGNTNDPNTNLVGWDRLPSTAYTFNTVNVLDFIPKTQHSFIKNNQPDLQDKTAVTNGINMASLYARTYLKEPTFIIPSGEYATDDTVLIDLPNNSNIQFNGVIAAYALNKTGVVIGSYDTNRFYYNFSNIAVYHKDIAANIASDSARIHAAVLLMNIVAAKGNIKRANGFSNGVLCDGSKANGGSSYNHVTLGYIKDNVYCLRLKMTLPSGYTNENTFYGGSMGHSSSFPFTGQEVDIKVDQGSETQALNNNLFFRPSLESNSATTKAAILEGNNNQIYMPRIENSQNYGSFTIEFGTTSNTCSVFGMGFGLKNNNIVDNGANNKAQTSATLMLNSDPIEGRAVLELKNTASNSGLAAIIKNTTNTETLKVFGTGVVESSQHGYFTTGIRWLTSSGTRTDRGLFVGSSDPNGSVTASVGSLYVSTSNSKIYTKKSGSGNTGWRELVELISGTTANRPVSNLSAGTQYFDTTLNKPIWYNGTAWVDAGGLTV